MAEDFAAALNAARGITVPEEKTAAPETEFSLTTLIRQRRDRVELSAKNSSSGTFYPLFEPIDEAELAKTKDSVTETISTIQQQASAAIQAQGHLEPQGVLNLLK